MTHQPSSKTLIVSDHDADRSSFHRRPSDRTYGRLHWVFFAIIAAILVYGFVVARFVSTPRAVGFRLVILILISFNVLWWSVADRRFARHIRSDWWSRRLRLGVLAFSILLNVPTLHMLATGRMSVYLNEVSTLYAAAFTLWHLGLVAIMPFVAVLRLAGLTGLYVARRIRHWRRPSGLTGGTPGQAIPRIFEARKDNCGTGVSPVDSRARRPCHTLDAAGVRAVSQRTDAFDPGRRAVLRTAFATVPMAMLAGGTVMSRCQEGRPEVNRHSLSAPWLPTRLSGLTITHISDLHVGRLYRPHMLRQLVDKANALDGDIVVITGDIVDHSNDMLPPALHALSQLTHRYGLFCCIGNHDLIDNRDDFIREVRRRIPLLINQHRVLDIGGERLSIGGLDYPGRMMSPGYRAGHRANLAATVGQHRTDRDGPLILLSHHPHAFDALPAAGTPLMLAGHTHGGQLMFSTPTQRPDIGIGRLLFKYTRGFYRRDGNTLFVNSGVGNWFPLRVRAPTEIVQIQLLSVG